jgi:hypothetical protein
MKEVHIKESSEEDDSRPRNIPMDIIGESVIDGDNTSFLPEDDSVDEEDEIEPEDDMDYDIDEAGEGLDDDDFDIDEDFE